LTRIGGGFLGEGLYTERLARNEARCTSGIARRQAARVDDPGALAESFERGPRIALHTDPPRERRASSDPGDDETSECPLLAAVLQRPRRTWLRSEGRRIAITPRTGNPECAGRGRSTELASLARATCGRFVCLLGDALQPHTGRRGSAAVSPCLRTGG
jgi:hypothetical protein